MFKTELRGKDFEFLITPGDIVIKPEDFDGLMTPDHTSWQKVLKNDITWYQVGKDEFRYYREERGIRMAFNREIRFEKARKIVEEIEEKLTKYTGQEIEVLLVSTDTDH
ncbi:MAG TPA: hypothetical protein VM187_07650 [Niastella sp.]|nr:hypothetical protein [Niastella sp.]